MKKVWTKEQYQSLSKKQIADLSDEDFYELALKQKEFCPDMLLVTSEDEILKIFYESCQRKWIRND
jgi:hypothetical protein